jgi:MoaA/NifB/PqqE/SkfB family radical SAM enzyme
LEYLKDNGIPSGINYTFSKEHAIRNDIIKDLARHFEAELLYLVYKPVMHDVENQVAPNDVLRVAQDAARSGLKVAVDGPAVLQCLAKKKFVDVNHRGDVFQCSFVRKKLGNLLEQDFGEIWTGRGPLGMCPWIDLETGNCISHVRE